MVLVAAHDARAFHDAALADVATPIFIREHAGEVLVTIGDSPESRLTDGILFRPDTPLACALALSAKGAVQLRPLMARDDFRSAFGELELLQIETSRRGASPSQLLTSWLNNWLLQQLGKSTQHQARLHQELADIRCLYTELAEQFAAVEACVSEYNSFPLLAFCNDVDPGRRTGNSPALASDDFLHQLLPVRSTGLAAFELFIPPASTEDEQTGDLYVELVTAEDGLLVASWRLAAGAKPGWVGFILDHGITGPAKTLILRIGTSDGAAPPDVGLGKPNPTPRACALVNGTTPLPYSLALKLWAGLPGIRPPMLPHSILPEGNAVARPILISNSCFAAAELVSAKPPGLDFSLVTLIENGKELQIHPLDQHMSIVRLAAVLPGETGAAFAQFRCGHPRAPRMEVAAGSAPSLDAMIALLAKDAPAAGYSGWVSLPASASLRLAFALPQAADEMRDCYIAVRLVPGRSSSYAWARLTRLGFELTAPG
jgi:hypothetical protein